MPFMYSFLALFTLFDHVMVLFSSSKVGRHNDDSLHTRLLFIYFEVEKYGFLLQKKKN
jgi:hypothetical protein